MAVMRSLVVLCQSFVRVFAESHARQLLSQYITRISVGKQLPSVTLKQEAQRLRRRLIRLPHCHTVPNIIMQAHWIWPAGWSLASPALQQSCKAGECYYVYTVDSEGLRLKDWIALGHMGCNPMHAYMEVSILELNGSYF